MEQWMYWRQPAPVAPQVSASGMTLELAPSVSGPWTQVPHVALLESNDYWCQQRGSTVLGDCFLVKFERGSATHARGIATAVIDGKPVLSQPSEVVALPEPGLVFALTVMMVYLCVLCFWDAR